LAAGIEWEETALVSTTRFGLMVNPSTSRSEFSKLTTAAGLGHWRPHELRHSMVSLLSSQGVPLEDIGDVAGHAPGSKVTGAVYRHQIKPSAEVARTTMNALLASGLDAPSDAKVQVRSCLYALGNRRSSRWEMGGVPCPCRGDDSVQPFRARPDSLSG
jgi:hypothetical protein